MGREFVEAIEAAPIVAAVKDDQGLEKCLTSDVNAVFILYGDICTISDIVAKVKDSGKIAMVHMDLITGLSPRDVSTDFIRKYTRADGIITTKGNLITHAKEIGLATVLRYFVLDSMALISIEKQAHHSRESQPDMIEILPGKLNGFFDFLYRIIEQRAALSPDTGIKFSKTDFEGWAVL
jgi:glycerol uptake operon antiterminator